MPARRRLDVPARRDVACPRTHAASNTTRTGTNPATGTGPTTDPEGNRRGTPHVEAARDETADLETSPSAEDLAAEAIEVQKITMDANETEAPGGPDRKELVWDEEDSPQACAKPAKTPN
jgi:hypothetical protein